MAESNRYPLADTSILRFRRGHRFSIPAIRLDLYPLIGQVAVYWGAFEQKMDGTLAAFVAAENDADDEGWERRPFAKRKKMFKAKAAARFPGAIAEEIESILGAASVYYWQRNLIVHGHTYVNVVNGVGTPFARGTHNKRHIAMPLEAAHLERMYAEIGFLTGRIEDLTSADLLPCNLSWQDRLTLRAFVSTNLPRPPISEIVAPQHPA
jgi:hypothetical protein